MTPTTENSLFKSLKEEYTFKKNTSLEGIYNELDNVCTTHTYCNVQLGDSSRYNEAEILRSKLFGNDTKLNMGVDDFKKFNKKPNEFCLYLKYWLYDQIIIKELKDQEISQVLNDLKIGDKYKFFIDSANFCEFNILKVEEIKKNKLLIDYLENYDNAANKRNVENLICNSNYKHILNETIHQYNNTNAQCNTESNIHCKELQQCKNIYNITNLLKLQCNGDAESSPLSQQFFHNAGSYPQTTIPSTSLARLGDVDIQNTPASSPDNSSRVKIIVPFSVSLIGIFVTFFSLYKLTPFGPWLRRSILNVKNTVPNLDEKENYEILEHASKSDDRKIYGRPHYITYHAS
ncbi:PIR Superfamily Protein [Plasmodium ovale wallikeri]|uniref:PIR Superfamily Protein n=1 Tax=Plasmodium ovale wallikeri TaxID=864142 RepID=A0A1A9AFH6_PLAOA|nr:PIR Superfamily Protein [Plasmodium ovale wallikeri]SBT54929.1 PIR Superfamily Protein [Plasmodium ovale wallikeri]